MRTKPGTFEQNSALSHIGQHWTEITFTLDLFQVTNVMHTSFIL